MRLSSRSERLSDSHERVQKPAVGPYGQTMVLETLIELVKVVYAHLQPNNLRMITKGI